MCTTEHADAKENTGSPGTGAADGWESPLGAGDRNPVLWKSMEKHTVLVDPNPALLP